MTAEPASANEVTLWLCVVGIGCFIIGYVLAKAMGRIDARDKELGRAPHGQARAIEPTDMFRFALGLGWAPVPGVKVMVLGSPSRSPDEWTSTYYFHCVRGITYFETRSTSSLELLVDTNGKPVPCTRKARSE